MELVLNKPLLERLKDLIALFWQPQMGIRHDIGNYQRGKPEEHMQQPKKENRSKASLYQLNKLELWSICNQNNYEYIIVNRQDDDSLISITDESKNIELMIKIALKNGLSISQQPISKVMDDSAIQIYNQEYKIKNYNNCKIILEVIEKLMSINNIQPKKLIK